MVGQCMVTTNIYLKDFNKSNIPNQYNMEKAKIIKNNKEKQ